MLREHLLKTDYYTLLSEQDKNVKLGNQKEALLKLLQDHRYYLKDSHLQYFDRSIDLITQKGERIPQAYGCPKIHKEGKKSNCPVISSVGSIPQVFSKYADF